MRQVKIFGKYILSDDGKIYSEYVGRYLTLRPNGRGYFSTVLRDGGDCVNIRVHRLVAEHFVPNPHKYDEVNHIDGDKSNNKYTNLEWCTRSENIQHAYDNSLRTLPVGVLNPRCTLSEDCVREICIALLKGGKTAAIARQFKTSWGNVDSIRKKRNWKTISDQYFNDRV